MDDALKALELLTQFGPSLVSLIGAVKPLFSEEDQVKLQAAYDIRAAQSDADYSATDKALGGEG
jgi:hypothetical protein